MKPSNDHEAMSLILNGLSQKGVSVLYTWDGEEVEYPKTIDQTLTILDNLDECHVKVRLPNGNDSWIFFVMGNDPEEVACDYGVSLSEYLDPIVDPWWE